MVHHTRCERKPGRHQRELDQLAAHRRQLAASALMRWCRKIAANALGAWADVVGRQRTRMIVCRRFCLKLLQQASARAWNTWLQAMKETHREQARERVLERQSALLAQRLFVRMHSTLLPRVFLRWAQLSSSGTSERAREHRLEHWLRSLLVRMSNRRLSTSWETWRHNVQLALAQTAAREARAAMEAWRNIILLNFVSHWRNTACSRAFRTWRSNTEMLQVARQREKRGHLIVTTRQARMHRELMCHIHTNWRAYVDAARGLPRRNRFDVRRHAMRHCALVDTAAVDVEEKLLEMQEYAELLSRQRRDLEARHARVCVCAVTRALRMHARYALLRFRIAVRVETSLFLLTRRKMDGWRLRHALKAFMQGIEINDHEREQDHNARIQSLGDLRSSPHVADAVASGLAEKALRRSPPKREIITHLCACVYACVCARMCVCVCASVCIYIPDLQLLYSTLDPKHQILNLNPRPKNLN